MSMYNISYRYFFKTSTGEISARPTTCIVIVLVRGLITYLYYVDINLHGSPIIANRTRENNICSCLQWCRNWSKGSRENSAVGVLLSTTPLTTPTPLTDRTHMEEKTHPFSVQRFGRIDCPVPLSQINSRVPRRTGHRLLYNIIIYIIMIYYILYLIYIMACSVVLFFVVEIVPFDIRRCCRNTFIKHFGGVFF